jgi:hypothetical protein
MFVGYIIQISKHLIVTDGAYDLEIAENSAGFRRTGLVSVERWKWTATDTPQLMPKLLLTIGFAEVAGPLTTPKERVE